MRFSAVESAVVPALLFAALLTQSAFGTVVPALQYQLTVSDDLREIQVQVRLTGDGRTLLASKGDTRYLAGLESCDGSRAQIRGKGIHTGGLACLRYRYPLKPQSGRRSPPVLDNVIVTSPEEWLWVPELRADEVVAIQVAVPEGMAVSVPWVPVGAASYELSASPGSSTGTAVFGAFRELPLTVGEARLRVALLDGPGLALDSQKTLDWLSAAATDVFGVADGFPNPATQVIVQAVRSEGRSPVPFGYVIRDGGETVRFFVDPGRSREDYLADWTATHEFAHLLLPYVQSREKWVSEGFASYYQNVLLARRGIYTEADAWWRLVRSFRRADEVQNPPALDQLHRRSFGEMRMLVYWSGAALALQADVRLRTLSDGRESLDTVLARLALCCLPSGETWSAEGFFSQLDELTEYTVFMPLYHEFMAERGMPDLSGLYRELGIAPTAGAVKLRQEGRLSAVREAIMSPQDDSIER